MYTSVEDILSSLAVKKELIQVDVYDPLGKTLLVHLFIF